MNEEIPKGYKRTEIGVIPEDWEVKRLGEVAQFFKGKGLPKSALDPYGSDPCVHYGELFTQYGEVINETISRTAYSPDYFRSMANDVLMPTSDVTPRGLAKASCVLNDGVVLGGDILIIRSNPKLIYGVFLSYLMRREEAQILRLISGTTVFHLHGSEIAKFTFALPPIAEQRAIVEALADVDGLLESLDKLIAKKRAIKQAAMQQLLTGKTRLPGFSGDWDVKRLGEVAHIQRGASPRPIDDPIWFDENSSVGWLRISDITHTNKYLLETTQKLSKLGIAHSRFVGSGNLIMSICATVGKPIILKRDVCIHDGFVVFANLKAEIEFLYYYLENLEPKWASRGQTGSQTNLNTNLISKTSIFIPPLAEQRAIAEALSDMDAEIEALERRQEKTRQVKQGMMQQLLTGQVHLVKPTTLLQEDNRMTYEHV